MTLNFRYTRQLTNNSQKKMNIAIIRRKFNPFGGAENFISRAIQALSDKVKISVISEEWNPSSEATNNFEFIQASASGFSRKSKFIAFQKSVNKILLTHEFDLIQSHERLTGADIYRLGDGIHAAWVQRQYVISPWYRKLLLRLDPYHCAVINTEKLMALEPNLTYVANSPLVKKELISWYQVPETRITLIENGIDTSTFTPASTKKKHEAKLKLGLNPQKPTVLFVGSGFERKGAFELIEAVNDLPDWQLIIVGADKKIRTLNKVIRNRKTEDRVLVTGPQHDIHQFLDAADIFCLPSLYDSFPNAILEALCSGLPVVTTNAVGIAEAIESKKAGVICERTPQSIKTALRKALQHKDEMSKNALALSVRYDIKIANQLWLELYQQLITKKKARNLENITH